jgi:hypothetical protein
MTFKPSIKLVLTPSEKVAREAKLPSLPRRMVNAVMAVGRSVRSVATGKRLKVSAETAEKRRAICQENKCGFYRASDQRCGKCGCPSSPRGFIPDKAQLLAEFCPMKLWAAGEMK